VGLGRRGDYAKTRDSSELVGISGSDSQAVCEGGRGDPKVMSADERAALREPCPNVGVYARNPISDRDRV
jgi:hypothetical protein